MAVVLGVALVMCGARARRYPIAPGILLVLVGVLIGFVPNLRQAQLPPEVMPLPFLPVLLYWKSLTTSLREIPATKEQQTAVADAAPQRPRRLLRLARLREH
jgi:NhaP-type Na+/H+ or K+/H+ antiporter